MKAAVLGDAPEEPQHIVYNAKLMAIAQHYGFTPRACRAYRAKTKGKVERPYPRPHAVTRCDACPWRCQGRESPPCETMRRLARSKACLWGPRRGPRMADFIEKGLDLST